MKDRTYMIHDRNSPLFFYISVFHWPNSREPWAVVLAFQYLELVTTSIFEWLCLFCWKVKLLKIDGIYDDSQVKESYEIQNFNVYISNFRLKIRRNNKFSNFESIFLIKIWCMKENALFLLGCSADEFGEEKAVALQIHEQTCY